ncbi:MAG: rod shape-determining protein MreD [Melioribacteraceae bacterium]|nr:rod shape-determining protein MreD [Melioribacteraceae bacterium]
MIRNLTIALIYFLPVIFVQLFFVPLISFRFIVPDLIVIFLVFYSLRDGRILGSVLGFFVGFLFDLFSGGIIGISMFTKTLVGFTAGSFKDEHNDIESRNILFVLGVILLASILNSVFFTFLSINEIINIVEVIFNQGVLGGVYTVFLSIPFVLFKVWRYLK